MASLISFSLPKPTIIKATLSSSPSPSPSPTTLATTIPTTIVEGVEEKFGRKGIRFLESNNTPVVELTVRNGSSVRVSIPDAHVTSYKPKVYWKDDGFYELLYTLPGSSPGKAKGGIGLVLNDASSGEVGSKSKVPSSLLSDSFDWTVKDVDSDSIDALQVELSCSSGTLDLRYVVSLYPLGMATAVVIKNNGGKDVTLTGAILSHLKLKKRNKAGIQGFRGCSYCSHPPPPSSFEIISPVEAMKPDSPDFFDFGFQPEEKPGIWKVQDVPFTILKHRLSRIYAAHPQERLKPIYRTPPTKYEMLDQGHELFFRLIRLGFQDTYLCSPGSSWEKYGTDYFICTGPAATLVPIIIKPGEEFRGAQVIEHDNL